jgi:hypothetical protein
MPLCTLVMVSLAPGVSIPRFLSSLRENGVTPLVQAKAVRWIILPSTMSIEPLLARNVHWDLLLALPNPSSLPAQMSGQIAAQWSLVAGIPSRIINGFKEKNQELLNPPPNRVQLVLQSEKLKAASAQGLELTSELEDWIQAQGKATRNHAVSMLNLLAFNEGLHDSYVKYGQEFARRAGSRHGGDAKLVGNVISGQAKEDGWDEMALAHYPSLEHFAAMLGSADYQDANKKYRQGSLKDTFILCTMEIGDDGELVGGRSRSKI